MKAKVASDFYFCFRYANCFSGYDGMGWEVKSDTREKIGSNKLIGKCTQRKGTFSTLQKVLFKFCLKCLGITGIFQQCVKFSIYAQQVEFTSHLFFLYFFDQLLKDLVD